VKLFLTIFFAILAAAAVLVGAAHLREKHLETKAQDLSLLESYTRVAESAANRVSMSGNVDDFTIDHEPSKDFEQLLKRGRAERAKARALAVSFVIHSEEIVALVRKTRPDKIEWADRTGATLRRILTAAE
jgi:hypothetical protein